MGHWVTVTAVILLTIELGNSQYFDFYQGEQLYPQPASRSDRYQVTKDPYPSYYNSEEYEEDSGLKRAPISTIYDGNERDRRPKEKTRRKSTTSNLNIFPTTPQAIVKKRPNTEDVDNSEEVKRNIKNSWDRANNSKKLNNNSKIDSRNDNRQTESIIQANNIWADGTNGNDHFTRPNQGTSQKPNRNTNYTPNYNSHTTQNPLYVRPGVVTSIPENRAPITNKPVTVWPNLDDRTTKTVVDVNDDVPDVVSGIDEDTMSSAQKRRYIEIAEQMCDKYKSMSTKQLQAIPLLPSPEPVAVNVSSCTPTNIPLVVGGKVVGIKEFPHMALLGWIKLNKAGYSWMCGGSLLSDRYVLTAGHCAYQERDNTVSTGPPRVVQLGSSTLNDAAATVISVVQVTRHPKYKFPTSYNDLALVKLATTVKFSDVIRPACLGVPPAAGEPVIATGWGKTEFGPDQSLELRSVSLPVWDMRRCQNVLGTSRKIPEGPSEDNQVCAGEIKGGKDTCQGDSGGPAQTQDGCLWRIVAVTSLGRSCGAPGTPGVYAKVQRAFISATIFGDQVITNQQQNPGDNHQSSDENNQGNVNRQDFSQGSKRHSNNNQGITYNQQDPGNNYQGSNVNNNQGSFNRDSNQGRTQQSNNNRGYDNQYNNQQSFNNQPSFYNQPSSIGQGLLGGGINQPSYNQNNRYDVNSNQRGFVHEGNNLSQNNQANRNNNRQGINNQNINNQGTNRNSNNRQGVDNFNRPNNFNHMNVFEMLSNNFGRYMPQNNMFLPRPWWT